MNDDKQILSKLSIEDYNAFLILTKLEDKVGLLKEESTSELLRFTTRRILSQILDDQTYRYLEQEQKNKRKLKTISSNNNNNFIVKLFYRLLLLLLLLLNNLKFLTIYLAETI
jgi:hypothetical protein